MKTAMFVIALAFAQVAGASAPPGVPAQDKAPQETSVPDNVGTARMLEDRSIVLNLIYWFPGGGHTTPTQLRYEPGHPEYADLLRHLGGMKPGETKGVKPWPETRDVPPVDFNSLKIDESKLLPWLDASAPKGQ